MILKDDFVNARPLVIISPALQAKIDKLNDASERIEQHIHSSCGKFNELQNECMLGASDFEKRYSFNEQ